MPGVNVEQLEFLKTHQMAKPGVSHAEVALNYRSAIVFGTAKVVEDPGKKFEVLHALTNEGPCPLSDGPES
jgi:nitroimidazol reductase NimA-like FMN-containing flavoprotein (pyridoxamine 5'-phosphate oxidase superfamily)